jgi:hypothetical protein
MEPEHTNEMGQWPSVTEGESYALFHNTISCATGLLYIDSISVYVKSPVAK